MTNPQDHNKAQDPIIIEKSQLPNATMIVFQGDWKWLGALPEQYMVRLCDFADKLQDEASQKGEL